MQVDEKIKGDTPRNLVEILRQHADPCTGSTNRTAFTFLQDGETPSGTVSYGDLDRRARSVAVHLQQVVQPGDRVLLVYPPSIDFTVAFFACAYAGCVAVPAIPPTGSRHFARLRHIFDDASAKVALTIRAVYQRVHGLQGELGGLSWLCTDQLEDASLAWSMPAVEPSDLAFLQYTSGSTGMPKGVMISHQNVLANLHHGALSFGGAREGDTGVSWLPQHHDFGLIGSVLGTVYGGAHCVQLPPLVVLMKPALWLKALTRYKARVLGAPNFAYELCTRRVTSDQKRHIDLSSIEIAVNGSEPVRPETLRRFAAAFAECGFNSSAFAVGYGLAESTLMVSATHAKQRGDSFPRTIRVANEALHKHELTWADNYGPSSEFSCAGAPLAEHEVVIVASDVDGFGHETSGIGEIWVRGPSVALGYWGRESETTETFRAQIAGSDDFFMRTGDLGFLHDGDLYITGRLKEMMIFGGKNVYPHDIESGFSDLSPKFLPFSCAAFSVESDNREKLVLVQEVADASDFNADLVADARAKLLEAHGISELYAVLLVRAGALPRTTSGKIQRNLCRDMFLNDAFSVLWLWRADELSPPDMTMSDMTTALEQRLLEICQECLGGASIDLDDDYMAVGVHSIFATQLVARIQAELQIDLPLESMFRAKTLRELVREIEGRQNAAPSVGERIELIPRGGGLPLSSAQKRLWFLDRLRPGSEYIMPLAMRIHGELNLDAVNAALREIVARHESLRTVFIDTPAGPLQNINAGNNLALKIIEVPHGETEFENRLKLEATRPFDLAQGPLLRATLFNEGQGNQILLLSMHHIVADGWSVGLLMRELSTLYAAFSSAGPAPLLPLPVQYADFAAWHNQYLSSARFKSDLNWWQERLAELGPVDLPLDFPRSEFPSGRGAVYARTLDGKFVRGIDSLAAKNRCTRYMVLLASFFLLLHRYSGQDAVCVGTPVANRLRPELEPMIGFFANTLVLRSRSKTSQSFLELLANTREEVLSALSHQSVPFEALVDGVPRADGRRLFQVMFVLQNALGSMETLPGVICEPVLVHNGTAKFDLTLNIVPQENGLTTLFEYSTDIFLSETIEAFSAHYFELLQSVLAAPHAPMSEHFLTVTGVS